jgi:hypothetical protein
MATIASTAQSDKAVTAAEAAQSRNFHTNRTPTNIAALGQRRGRRAKSYIPVGYFVCPTILAEVFGNEDGTTAYQVPGQPVHSVVVTSLDVAVSDLQALVLPPGTYVRGMASCIQLHPPAEFQVVLAVHDDNDGNSTDHPPPAGVDLWRSGEAYVTAMSLAEVSNLAICRMHKTNLLKVVPKSKINIEDDDDGAFRILLNTDMCDSRARSDAAGRISSNMANTQTFLREFSGSVPVSLPNLGITRFATRHVYDTTMTAAAAKYLSHQCESMGYSVTLEPVEFSYWTKDWQKVDATADNVICIKHPASGATSQIAVIGAHYDSTSESPESAAPGAIDNGSGSAVVVAVAEALVSVNLAHTVHFVFFAAEEIGLHGSLKYVSNRIAGNMEILGAVTLDMVAFSGNNNRGLKIEYQPGELSNGLIATAQSNFVDYAFSNLGQLEEATYPWGSDHVNFIKANIPAFLFIQKEDIYFAHYHKSTDTSSIVDYTMLEFTARASIGTLYDLACPMENRAGTAAPVTTAPLPCTILCEEFKGIRPLV